MDGSGVELTELLNSTVFVDSSGDGLLNRTAWAASGNGVLFYDADGDGAISEKREYVFTEWDPTATSDIEALRAVFDSNGDGVFDANDEAWDDFKVLVTNADGSLEAKTLAELGITSIDLTADATNIELPDGSVITGKTTFTYADGSTGTVADTTLVSDTASYRIEESEAVDSEGVRTHIQTGYGADGAISFVITSVTTADGASITNSYDTNGDGVVDQLQTIVTVANPDGSNSETVTNVLGADLATGILLSETKTTTSADGNTVTIERDSTGGGWYDQTEVRTTHTDDSMTIVTTDRDPNGGVIRSSTETVSADGLTRTDAIDEDGDGLVDLTITHSIVINGDGSRSETIEHFNQDGSLRSAVTESVSADGQTKTIARDLDGDGDTDVQEELDITVNVDGTTDSTLTVKNGDGSVRSSTTHSQSEDALTKTSAVDQDGDGDTDLTTVEATVINANGSRETETTLTNADGSVRAKTKVTLGSDQVSSETWVDHNQDGTFQATDLSRSVTVDGTTGERTTTSWTRNADGSFSAQSVSVSSEDGLIVNTTVDADGDGDTDLSISDVTVENTDGSSTRTIAETAQNAALKSEQVVTTSADGLTVTTLSDVNGDGVTDGKSVSTQASNPDGSTLQTTTSYAGDQATLLGESTVSQSADRRLTITTSDANGDGATDMTLRSEKHADGSMTELDTRFSADGTTLSTRQTDVSADGLTITTISDVDGDGDTDTTSLQATVLNADGGRTTTSTVRNGDDSLRSEMVTAVSDDGLVTTTTEDIDGDGIAERSVTSTTVLNADGSQKTTEDVQSSDGTLLSRSETTTSDDGLTVETRADTDGDQTADIVTTSVTTLNDDGSTTVTTEVTDVTGTSDVLRSKVVTTTSDNGRDILEATDINGDGHADMQVHRVIGDDGFVTVTESELNSDGSLQSRMVSTTSDTGLESTTQYDADGDGIYERSMDSTTVLNADGSTTQTVEEKAEDGTVYSRMVTDTSRDGWTTTTREDLDNDGDDDLTTTQVYDLSTTGVETTTVTRTAADGSTLSTDTTTVSADKRSTTRSVDTDGNGINDMVSTATIADDGTQNQQTQYYDDTGTLIANTSASTSGDGLIVTSRTDRNGDGTDELVAIATTVLGADGSRSVTTDYTDGGGSQLAQTVATTSDDGLSTSWSADLDGDGTNEFVTTGATTFEAHGDVVQTATTTDGAGNTLSSATTTTSGNGLSTSTQFDLDGDGANDIIQSRTTQADGSWTQTEQQFGSDGSSVHEVSTTQSADGRTLTTRVDEDGDGTDDRDLVIQVDLDRTTTSTWRDLATDGSADTVIVGTELSNGTETDYAFDLDGDGEAEFTRSSDMQYDVVGNRITRIEEQHADRLTFTRTITDSADGLSQTVATDIDGDGSTDSTSLTTTTLHDDGRQTVRIDATYADGETKSTLVRDTSADGRNVTETRDYDGDGKIDLNVTAVTGADGRITTTERSYDAEGDMDNTRTTSVSADGLETTITTDETSFTITRSPLDNGSYEASFTGEDTSFTSEHQVDGAGIETWSLQRTEGLITSSFEARLDASSKARVIAEAERLYDTLLDRDLDTHEYETLVAHIENGELDLESLAEELITSDEYQARFPGMSDGAFIDRVYTNAYGRGASLSEFDTALTALDAGDVTQARFATQVSESSEHLVVGNSHMASNNFNVLLSPAQAERSTDRAYIKSTATRIIDILYGKSLFDPALTLTALHVINGAESIQGFATRLVEETTVPDPDSDLELADLTDAQFVSHIFTNAFEVVPPQSDLDLWRAHLENDRLTRGELVVLVARSTEYLATGNQQSSDFTQIAGSDPADLIIGAQLLEGVAGDDRNNVIDASSSTVQNQLSGGAGNDTLLGGSSGDILIGGAGADTLQGNGGDDTLFIDAADLASGNVQGGDGYDTARIMGSDDVTLILAHHGLEAAFGGDGSDTISGAGLTDNTTLYGGDGDDTITGGNGDDELFGDTGNDQINGGDGGDTIFGGTGADTINGDKGADTLLGGTGNDTLNGGMGHDYINGGDGNDILHAGENNTVEIREIKRATVDEHPDRLIVGDFDGDGYDDRAVFWRDSGQNRILSGNADGGYSYSGNPISKTSIDENPKHYAVGDFNGDGRDDLAVTWSSSGQNRFYFGNSNRTFSGRSDPIKKTNIDESPTRVITGDFNGDGRDDLMFHWSSTGQNRFYLGNANKTFTGNFNPIQKTKIDNGSTTGNVYAVHSGDYDGDGYDDLAFFYKDSGSLKFVYGNKEMSLSVTHADVEHSLIQGANFVRAGDFDGDGLDDIVFASTTSGNNIVILGSEDRSQEALRYNAFAANTFTGSNKKWGIGDFNNDGVDEIMKLDRSGGANAYYNMEVPDVLLGGEGDDTLHGHSGRDYLDGGEGDDTVSYESSDSGVTINLETGSASGGYADDDTLVNIENLTGSVHADTLIGDLFDNSLSGNDGSDVIEGHGGRDLIDGGNGNDTLSGGGGSDVLKGGEGSDILKGDTSLGNHHEFASTVDVFGDGQLIWEKTAPLVGDFNGDGLSDIAYSLYKDGSGHEIRTKLSNGDGTYVSTVDVFGDGQLIWEKTAPLVGDFNGDGLSDIAYSLYKDGSGHEIRTKLSNGDGTYVSTVDVFGDGQLIWEKTAPLVGDFNGDGLSDIAYSLYKDGSGHEIRTKLSNGDGTYVSTVDVFGDGQLIWEKTAPLVGDFNGDGLSDIAYSLYKDGSGHEIRTKLSNGDGTYVSTVDVFGDGQLIWEKTAPLVGDFNGDGLSDIAYSLYKDGSGHEIRTKLSNGDGTYVSTVDVFGDGQLIWEKTAPLVGDFNSDGLSDIAYSLYKDGSGHEIRTKLSNGDGTYVSTVDVFGDGQLIWEKTAPLVGDFNSDGLSDIAYSLYKDGSGHEIRTKFAAVDEADELYGEAGDDQLDGGAGNDFLDGGLDNDILTGGTGADVFHFEENFGTDTITDFEDGSDLIRIDIDGASYGDLDITESNGDTMISLDGHGSITLEDVAASLITEDDLNFV
ncbi:hemolysin-type calcium-binding protein [Rhodobacteraceae bacterium KLH11]|nr:hemolysin-type calcium-binding protein [Rhodobacteraceae bacterium KLH11]